MKLYRRGKVYWARFTVDGKRYQITTRETTKGAAETRANELFQSVRQGKETKQVVTPTLRQLAEGKFLDWVNGSMRLQFKSKEYYRYGWLMLKASKLPDVRIDKITAEDADCLDVGGSASNQNCARRTLRRIFKLAIEWGLVDKTCKVRTLEEAGREATVDGDTERSIQEVIIRGVLKVTWPIFLDTGLRPKEMAGLLVSDLDFTNGAITIRRPTTKSLAGKRAVPMSARTAVALLAHLGGRSEGFVFPSPRRPGRHVTGAAMTKAFANARRLAGVPLEVKLYSSRHTYGTDMMESLGNPAAVQKLMGHSDIATTMRYMHPKMNNISRAIDERNESRKSATVFGTVH